MHLRLALFNPTRALRCPVGTAQSAMAMAMAMAMALVLACLSIASTAAHGAHPADWPRIALPPAPSSHEPGDEISMVGMPLRLTVFTSREPPAALAKWFSASLGQPLTRDRVGGKTILGRRQGGHYITLQLESAGGGTRGLITVSDVASFLHERTRNQEDDARWQARLPAGTRVLSRMHSRDGARQSDYVVATNRHSEQINVEALSTLLAGEGLELERDAQPTSSVPFTFPSGADSVPRRATNGGRNPVLQRALASGRTLFYRGHAREAMAIIARDAQGNTSLVISLVHHTGTTQ
jgi:hypothetical protein